MNGENLFDVAILTLHMNDQLIDHPVNVPLKTLSGKSTLNHLLPT